MDDHDEMIVAYLEAKPVGPIIRPRHTARPPSRSTK
jgi:hypothetical protein